MTALAVAIALIAAAATGVTASRLAREQERVEQLRARQAQIEAELDELRQRLRQGGGGVLDGIAAAVGRLRGLSFQKPVKATVLANQELRRRVIAELEEGNPRAEVEKSAKVLRTLGLLEADQDLYRIYLDVQQEQVGGYYDTDAKTMVVGGDANDPSPLERTLLAHEYTHALTDQHFDLGRLEALTDAHKDDEAEAFLSLIEGDATVLMGAYARDVLTGAEQQEFGREASAIETKKLDAAPKALRASLLFPYDAGARFVRALFNRGGNAEIDRAYRDPPTSTEQIIHPERYYGRRDAPTAVSMPNLASAMGSDWRSLQEGGVGELDVRLILGQFLAAGDSNEAAAGWDGGRYSAVESPFGIVLAMLTAWDSPQEAREAGETFGDWLPDRYGRRGGEKRIPGFTGTAWEGPGGAGEVLRSGSRLLVVLGPNLPTVERARGAFSLGPTA